MRLRQRVVVDTNALISRLLTPASPAALAVRKAVDEARLLVSVATLEELADVLSRPKFDPYVTPAERQEFVQLLGRIAELIVVASSIQACRDSRDDKFLELAVDGHADLVITGDADLLALNPFRGIPVITPASYLARR
ncbi:MAG TPA: putative toxin-antitoxin system toxin component, PIN family [Candidatus Binataceae bacterium]|jgi:putative PIN family toxin of toxin-antitoxin system|nr:putative toxin-antitoxin system toxin component, PIN family [Candidatus Binataceae bacterium]